MSVNSKLVVKCKPEDELNVLRSVKHSIDAYIIKIVDEHWKNNSDAKSRFEFIRSARKENCKLWSHKSDITTFDFNLFYYTFGIGEERMLTAYLGFDTDYDGELPKGNSVIFGIGLCGKSEEIMMCVADAAKEFGDVYYDRNDCDDEEFVKLF